VIPATTKTRSMVSGTWTSANATSDVDLTGDDHPDRLAVRLDLDRKLRHAQLSGRCGC
jgi:hypothetical protein